MYVDCTSWVSNRGSLRVHYLLYSQYLLLPHATAIITSGREDETAER